MNSEIRALFLHVIHKKRNFGEKLGLIKLYYAGKAIVKRVSLMTTSEILVAFEKRETSRLNSVTKVFVMTCKLSYLFSFCIGRETKLLGSIRVVLSLTVYPVLF